MKLQDLEEEALTEAVLRLRRVEGQIGGLVRMIESGRECRDVVTQISAASTALNQVGFKLLATALRYCVRESGRRRAADMERELERLFLQLA